MLDDGWVCDSVLFGSVYWMGFTKHGMRMRIWMG